jgi:hypothetical protein
MPFPAGAGRVVSLLALCAVCAVAAALAWPSPVRAAEGSAASRSGAPVARSALLPVGRVHINSTNYAWGSVKRIASYVRNVTWVQAVVRLANLCPNAQAYFFISGAGIGAVGWLPARLSGCIGGGGVEGGGPSGSPCAQAQRTPNGYYVVVAASNPTVCRDLTTQVPGGVLTQTSAALAGLPARSSVYIKCQMQLPLGLVDYVTRPAQSFPSSKTAWWVYDAYVVSGYRWLGVPSCWGTA